jgi:hypothetical protein
MSPKTSASVPVTTGQNRPSQSIRMLQWRQRAAAARVVPGLFWILCGWAVVLNLAVIAGGVLLLRTTPDFRPLLERALTALRTADTLPARLCLVSSAAFALAWFTANLNLVLMLLVPTRYPVIRRTAGLCSRALQVGVLLFVAGQVSLVTVRNLVDFAAWTWPGCFLVVLLARAVGWLKDFGLTLTVVVCAVAGVIDWPAVPMLVNWQTAAINPFHAITAWLCWAGLVNLSVAVHTGLRFLYWQPR